MYPNHDSSPFEIDFPLKKNFLAIDLIYNPNLTKFLYMAKERGAYVENGYNMLIYQALESLKIWLREEIEEDLFFEASKEVINA